MWCFERLFKAEQFEYSDWKELKGQTWKKPDAKNSKKYNISLDATLDWLEKYHGFLALRKTSCFQFGEHRFPEDIMFEQVSIFFRSLCS